MSREKEGIETAYGALKYRIDQALNLRGSSDFTDILANCRFLFQIGEMLNKRSWERVTLGQITYSYWIDGHRHFSGFG